MQKVGRSGLPVSKHPIALVPVKKKVATRALIRLLIFMMRVVKLVGVAWDWANIGGQVLRDRKSVV